MPVSSRTGIQTPMGSPLFSPLAKVPIKYGCCEVVQAGKHQTEDGGNWLSRFMYHGWDANTSNAEIHGAEFLRLPENSILIMRPILPHYVITPVDSAAIGFHFLNARCMDRAVAAELHTTFAGAVSTNIEHSAANWLLVRVFIFEIDSILSARKGEHVWDLEDPDQLFQFAILLAYCVVAPALDLSAYKHRQKHASNKYILPMFLDRFQEYVHVCKQVGIFERCSGKPAMQLGLQNMFEDAIIQMAGACVRYRESMERLDPVTHQKMNETEFTVEALTDQLANTLQTFEHLRNGGHITDKILDKDSPLRNKYTDEVKNKHNTFELFLNWDRADMPFTVVGPDSPAGLQNTSDDDDEEELEHPPESPLTELEAEEEEEEGV
ncbi:hypothetical protein C8F01DRAFT_546667 [Mycena amicta]|nr:hypothetical protein C8F01DRAFT_546667 [Mycena amicta]